MATRMQVRVTRRPSLPLTERDERDLELIRTSRAYQSALAALGGEGAQTPSTLSEAALLHAVFEAGLDAIRLAAQEAGYASLAQEQAAGTEWRRADARRRRPPWADEV